MADEEDEFDLPGGGLDDLAADDLRDIETQAYRSTQHQRAQSNTPHSAETHLNDAPPLDDLLSSDYGEDLITLNDEPIVTGPPLHTAAVPLQTATAAHPQFGGKAQPPLLNPATRRTVKDLGDEKAKYALRLSRHEANSNYNLSGDAASALAASPETLESKVIILTGRIEELELQIGDLQREKNITDADIMMKEGEAAILRGKAAQTERNWDDRLARLQKAHAQSLARLRAELDKLRNERDAFESHHRFLEEDLKAEATKAKQLQRAIKSGTAMGKTPRAQSTAMTPRKNRIATVGDGFFNDDNIVMRSPSKSREKSRTGTPRRRSKRKRTAGEPSPSKPLPFFDPEPLEAGDEGVVAMPDVEFHEDILTDIGRDDQKFKLLKRVMNHRPSGFQLKAFEAYTHFAFPSLPDLSLSSIIYDRIALYRDDSGDFPAYFCRILLSLWDRCAQDSYYEPLHLIIDTLQFVLAFETLEKTMSLTDEIVPRAQTSAWLVALPASDAQLKQHINLHECLYVLITLSRSCAQDAEAITHFWQLIHHDFVKSLLKSQPLSTLTLAIELLSTSMLPTTFGPIIDPDYYYSTNPNEPGPLTTLLDRLTALLHETPRPRPPALSLWTFRLHLLRIFSTSRSSPPTAIALITHHRFLGRLMVLLNAAITTLYTTAPCTPLATLLAHSINLATRIAYALVTGPDTHMVCDRKTRLSAVAGAGHAHLIALTRLAFMDVDDGPPPSFIANSTDGSGGGGGYGGSFCGGGVPAAVFSGGRVLEAGIDEEVVDMAHALLNEYLIPAEGKELIKVFASGESFVEVEESAASGEVQG